MKIGILCSEYPPSPHGGIGSVTAVLARALAARGHSVWVGGIYPESIAAGLEHQNDHGVEVVRFPYPKGKYGWVKARYRFYKHVREMMRQGELDVIEVPDWQGFAAGWPKLPGPVVVRLHGSVTYFEDEMGRKASRVHQMLEGSSFRRADYCCSTSRYTADRTAALFGSQDRRTTVLFNPVDVPVPAAAPDRDLNRVVFAGTLTPKKGIMQLVRAWPNVVSAFPSAELHLYGRDAGLHDGRPMFPFLMNELDAAVRPSIHWHGAVPRGEVLDAFRSARLSIFPSYSEAFSMVPLEAMIERCPVVYTTRSSGPELITDQVDGLLVDPDDHSGISNSILRLLRDDDLARALGDAGFQRVASTFSTQALIPRNEEFFATSIEDFRSQRCA